MEEKIYCCKHCGASFTSKQKLGGHSNTCKNNPNHSSLLKRLADARTHISEKSYSKSEDFCCPYCEKDFHTNKGAFQMHIDYFCKNNPYRKVRKISNESLENMSHIAWNKGLTKETDERVAKCAIGWKKFYSEHPYSFEGKHHTEETKQLLRDKTGDYYVNHLNVLPHYNKTGCEYIDNLNKKMGWNLQHAENGGEIKIDHFYLDGYDKERNIAFEYDESKHYIDVENNVLCEKDRLRQEYIIKKLKCDFYRYNEQMNYFYKVNLN